MLYYIVAEGKDSNTAGVKAPQDINILLKERGYKKIVFFGVSDFNNSFIDKVRKKIYSLINWGKLVWKIKKNSLVVVQYPYSVSRLAIIIIPFMQMIKKVSFAFILHDIDSIRGYNRGSTELREKSIEKADFLICHNESMKKWLLKRGINENNIVCLVIFDYLHNVILPKTREFNKNVIIAGNLGVRKSPYIKQLLESKRDYNLNLYGINFEKSELYQSYTYHGAFKPEELPSELKGSFGLVWDGESIETCSGLTGEYLKYNNPHKASLYIASQIPVIVWKDAAIADYIRNNHLGIAVSSLYEINDNLKKMTEAEYKMMYKNIVEESEKLRQGFYFNSAMDLIEERYCMLCRHDRSS